MSATLAPETEVTVREALAALDQIIADAPGDPIRYPLMVLRTHLEAEHRLFVDGALTINAAVEAAKRPINEDDLHRIERASSQGAVQGAHHHAVAFVAEQARKRLYEYVSIGIVAIIVAFGGGWLTCYLTRDPPVAFAGVRAGADVCDAPKPDGRLCHIPIWLPKT